MSLPSPQEYDDMQAELEAQGWVQIPNRYLMTHPDKPNSLKSLSAEIAMREIRNRNKT